MILYMNLSEEQKKVVTALSIKLLTEEAGNTLAYQELQKRHLDLPHSMSFDWVALAIDFLYDKELAVLSISSSQTPELYITICNNLQEDKNSLTQRNKNYLAEHKIKESYFTEYHARNFFEKQLEFRNNLFMQAHDEIFNEKRPPLNKIEATLIRELKAAEKEWKRYIRQDAECRAVYEHFYQLNKEAERKGLPLILTPEEEAQRAQAYKLMRVSYDFVSVANDKVENIERDLNTFRYNQVRKMYQEAFLALETPALEF